jgi:hypothetical protein
VPPLAALSYFWRIKTHTGSIALFAPFILDTKAS